MKCVSSCGDPLSKFSERLGVSKDLWATMGCPALVTEGRPDVALWAKYFIYTIPSNCTTAFQTCIFKELTQGYSRMLTQVGPHSRSLNLVQDLSALLPFEMKMKVAQSCPTLCEPVNYIVHGTFHTRMLEWVPFSRGSSQPRGRTQVSPIAGGFFTSWATREASSRNGNILQIYSTTSQTIMILIKFTDLIQFPQINMYRVCVCVCVLNSM